MSNTTPNTAVLVKGGYVRTPFARSAKVDPMSGITLKHGSYDHIRPDDMAAEVIKSIIKRTGIAAGDIDTVIFGTANPEGEQGNIQMRAAALKAGLPDSVQTYVMSQLCGSSLVAMDNAANSIIAGKTKATICIGIESMSRVPMAGYNFSPNAEYAKENPGLYLLMPETAENIVTELSEKYGDAINREAQEDFALHSHFKTATAWEAGHFDSEIIVLPQAPNVTRDECVSWPANEEKIRSLKPVYTNGTITAATSSPITDGVTGTLVIDADFAKARGLEPQAELGAFASVGTRPEVMGLGPVPTLKKLMELTGRSLDEYQIDLNEAFAAQAIGVALEAGIPLEKLNMDGGAIAIGHPLGASGIRLAGHLGNMMERADMERGIATACVGGGPAVAMELKNLKFGM